MASLFRVFVVSGASIDVKAVVANPALLITFILMLLLVRAVPIFVATTLDHRVNPLDLQDKLTVSLLQWLCCETLIVAVTSLAVQGGTMHQTTASTLVAAGAVTVFLMPLLGGSTSKLMKGETRLIAPTA